MVESEIDPVTLEILRNSFRNMCTQGSSTVERVAYGPVITEGHDYSVSLLTKDARLVAHGTRDQTPHLGTFEATADQVLKDIDEIKPGDVYALNMPYEAGTHTQDVRAVRPVFYDDEFIAFTMALCHWTDIGGPVPGTFNPHATEIYAEGLYLTTMRLYEDDEPVDAVFNLLRNNIRLPEERMGDLTAQYQATRTMERRLKERCDRYSKETILKAFEEIMDRAEKKFKEKVRELPDGTYEFRDFVDKDEVDPEKPRVKVHCQLTVDGEEMVIDWTKSDPEPTGPAGNTRPATISSTMDGVLHYYPELIPLNNGIIRCVDIVTEPGTCTHVTRPTPTAGYCAGVYEKVSASVMGCLAQPFASVEPKRISAGTVNLQNAVTGGTHPDTGKEYVSYNWLEGGQGARYDMDGPNFMAVIYAAGAANQPIEVHERWYPFLYTKCEGIQDSCGDGKYRGGTGIAKNYKMRGDGKLSIHGDREEVTPYGLAGGTNGGPNILKINAGTDDERHVGMFATNFPVEKGDHVTYYVNGGGGFGNPLERDPEEVLEDVIDGYISLDKAENVYGVSIVVKDEETLDYEINWDKTEELREELSKEDRPKGFGPWKVHPDGEKVKKYLEE